MTSLIGILGGTFDPVHYGHLTIATQLLNTLPFTEIQFVPCKLPVHRDQPGASAEERLAMLKLAIEPLPKTITINDCELRRTSPSYMIDTLEYLKSTYPQSHFALIMGYDAWINFLTWHRFEDILKVAHVILIHRPGVELPTQGDLATLLKHHQTKSLDDLLKYPSGKTLIQSQFSLTETATEIRQRIQSHQSLSDYLPTSVIDFIHQHHLYSSAR